MGQGPTKKIDQFADPCAGQLFFSRKTLGCLIDWTLEPIGTLVDTVLCKFTCQEHSILCIQADKHSNIALYFIDLFKPEFFIKKRLQIGV